MWMMIQFVMSKYNVRINFSIVWANERLHTMPIGAVRASFSLPVCRYVGG